MPRTLTDRIVRVVTEPLLQRDKLEMRAVNALLSAIEPKRRRRNRRPSPTNRGRSTKRPR